MCISKPPKPPAPAVPLPEETTQAAAVDTGSAARVKRSGRSKLTIPLPSSTPSGLSGLNIPR